MQIALIASNYGVFPLLRSMRGGIFHPYIYPPHVHDFSELFKPKLSEYFTTAPHEKW